MRPCALTVPQEVAAEVEAGSANVVSWKWLFDSIAAWSLLPVDAYATPVRVSAKGTARTSSHGDPLATIASPPQLSARQLPRGGADLGGLITRPLGKRKPRAGPGARARLSLQRSSTTPAAMN